MDDRGRRHAREDVQAERQARRPVQSALILLICIVVVLVGVGAFAADRIYSEGNHRFIDQAGPFFAVTEDISVEMLNEETGVRGYVITGNPSTLAPYTQGKKYVQLELGIIAKDQSFNRAIPGHLKALRAEVNTLQAYFAREIALVRTGPAGREQAAALTLQGKAHFDHFRAVSGALIADASAVIKQSHKNQHSTLLLWLIFLGVLGGIAVALALGLLLRVPQRLTELFREERVARREAEEGAEASRALAHVREAVLLLDESGTVRYANPTAETWFGSTAVLAQALEQFLGQEGATRPVTVDGRDRWLAGAETIFDGGRVLVLRDVSDERGLERLRADFVATAAHELRTPLAAVYGAVRTLRQSEYQLPPATAAELLEMIEVEAERLRIVMDQLLISAQIDSNELQLHRRRVDAVALVEDLARSAELHKPESVVLFVEANDPELPVDADPDRLRQVVANLLDNAIKYSPDGGTIHVRLFGDGDTGVIEVADKGIGIPLEEQGRIFEKFYRLDPDMTHGVGGSGLGLYISRELVRQMGGELTVTSRYGVGSTFAVRLPLMRDRTRTAPSRSIPSAAPPPSSKV